MKESPVMHEHGPRFELPNDPASEDCVQGIGGVESRFTPADSDETCDADPAAAYCVGLDEREDNPMDAGDLSARDVDNTRYDTSELEPLDTQEIELSPPERAYWGSEEFPAWSARLTFPEGGMPDDQFRRTINATAEAFGHRYTGFVTRDPDTSNITSFTRTIYPRKKYPVTNPEDCAEGMARLAESFGVSVEADNVQPDS
ncbi:MAG TPA: hypothetical protein VF809_03355 [Candidatus Saccharimonadales bacterium]